MSLNLIAFSDFQAAQSFLVMVPILHHRRGLSKGYAKIDKFSWKTWLRAMQKQSFRASAMEKQKSFRIAMGRQLSFGVDRRKTKDSPGKRGDSMLNLACRGGNLSKVIEILQNLGLDALSKQNQEGETPLYVAVENGHSHVIAQLLKHLDPQTASIATNNGYDPFHIAAKHGHIVSEFTETCGNDAVLSKVGILESCAAEGGNFVKLADISSVQEYVVSNMEKKSEGQTPVLVVCNGGNEQPHSEGQVLSELISSVEKTGAKYSVLYVSNNVNVIHYPSYRQVDRFLAEKSGNLSKETTECDGVCQIKSSLLEGLLVGLVLLIILISGLCCMAGIDTPTRFEAPKNLKSHFFAMTRNN